MPEPEAFLHGRFLPLSQAAISIADAGFVLGVTATEQLRTFGGRLFRLDEHLRRLGNTLDILGVDAGMPLAEIGRTAQELVARNYPLLTPTGTGAFATNVHPNSEEKAPVPFAGGLLSPPSIAPLPDDLGVGIFVTPGPYGTLSALAPSGPVVGIYTFPLPFQQWAATYERGQALRTTAIEQVSDKCWPRELKVRSRVHYYLADRQAAAGNPAGVHAEPGARAILLDQDGFLTEATTANLLIYTAAEGLLTPPTQKVLPGITLSVVKELATAEGIPYRERDLLPAELALADEALLCSTSSCVLPVVRFNGRPIGSGDPGAIFRRLLAAWNRLVGFDVVAQAQQFAKIRQPDAAWSASKP